MTLLKSRLSPSFFFVYSGRPHAGVFVSLFYRSNFVCLTTSVGLYLVWGWVMNFHYYCSVRSKFHQPAQKS